MRKYEVKPGDSLWKIAKRESTTVDVLAHLNGLRGRQIHSLHVGQQLNFQTRVAARPIAC
ncbi:LysM peptidoglycan-binding domain-containing protein [Caballeronia sp. GAFFF1]|uniref:LysM peptidoglycan-binding domain-containing protein n=1 Tax=Caballeronia sp. GAFFF1 TaxID=2921779 RepID=UPI0032EB5417